MAIGLTDAAILGTNRKSIQDFQREEEEFNARRKQRQLEEQMGGLELEKAKRDLSTPAERFGGNDKFSLIANVAYKDALAKTGDPDLAEKMAINTALKSNPQWTSMPDPSNPYAPPILRQTVGNPIFDVGDPMAASQAAIGQRQADIGINPNQRPSYLTGGFNPDADLQVRDMNEADILAAIDGNTPLNIQGVMDAMQAPTDMVRPSVPQPNIDPRAMNAPNVQMDVAKDYMKLPIEQQRLQMQTKQKLMEEQALAEQQKQRELPETKNFAERAFIQSMDDSRNINSVIDQAIQDTGMLTAGFGGSFMGNFAGSGAVDLKKTIDTIEADAAFTRLQEMRDASKTGGALGAISERELDLLKSARAAIDPSQSPKQLRENLERYRAIRNNALSNVAEAFKDDYGYYPKGYNKYKQSLTKDVNNANDLIDYYSGL